MSHTPEPNEPRDAFSADWLSLREPFDQLARERAANTMRLPTHLKHLTDGLQRPLRVMDLGCGTGSNLRWLAPRLAAEQEWLVVDHDEALLQAWPERFARQGLPLETASNALHAAMHWPSCVGGVHIVRRPLDLASRLHELPWSAVDLVTASALIDLVSEDWLQRLVNHTRDAGAALLLTLSVDGRHRWTPKDPDDALVGHAFAAHQRRDKGFGAALGAQAVPVLKALLTNAGYGMAQARSDWEVATTADPRAQALYLAMVEGMGNAAREHSPTENTRIQAWQGRRTALAARAGLVVGHTDVFAWPLPDGGVTRAPTGKRAAKVRA